MARLSPSSDISHTIADTVNKYGTGGGASPFSTWYENLLTSNSDTSWLGNNLGGGNADFAVSMGMPTIAPGNTWNVFLNGTVDVFNSNNFEISTPYTRIKVRLVDSAGDAWDSAVIDVSSAAAPTNPNSLREQWVDMPTFQIVGSGTPAATGQTANSIILHVLGDAETPDAYFGVTYLAIELASKTITISSDANSAWDSEGAVSVAIGSTPTYTLTPSAGYKVADVLVDSVSVGDARGDATYPYTFAAIAADHTLSGTAVAYKTVTVSSDSHCAWDSEGAIVVLNAEDSATFHLTCSAGYQIVDVLVDSVSVGDAAGQTTYSKQFTGVVANHTLSATSVAIPYPDVDPVLQQDVSGDITMDATSTNYGDTVRVHVAPASGRRITHLRRNGVSIAAETNAIYGTTNQVRMDATPIVPIELDEIVPLGGLPLITAQFDPNVSTAPRTGFASAEGLGAGMGHEDLGSRFERINRGNEDYRIS